MFIIINMLHHQAIITNGKKVKESFGTQKTRFFTQSTTNHITNTNHFNQMQQSQRRELNKLMSLGHSYMNALSILGIALTKEQRLGKELAEKRQFRATYNYQ